MRTVGSEKKQPSTAEKRLTLLHDPNILEHSYSALDVGGTESLL